jgi:hypothetical protein
VNPAREAIFPEWPDFPASIAPGNQGQVGRTDVQKILLVLNGARGARRFGD